MNKRELVDSIAEQVDASKKQVEDVLDSFMETVGDTLKKGEKVAITGFGSFEARQRAARTGQNPQTGEKMRIKATVVPAFKAGQGLRDTVAGPANKASANKASAKKAATKKASAKKASAKKAATKKAATKRATAKKAVVKTAAKKAATKKSIVKKAAAKKTSAKKAAKKR